MKLQNLFSHPTCNGNQGKAKKRQEKELIHNDVDEEAADEAPETRGDLTDLYPTLILSDNHFKQMFIHPSIINQLLFTNFTKLEAKDVHGICVIWPTSVALFGLTCK